MELMVLNNSSNINKKIKLNKMTHEEVKSVIFERSLISNMTYEQLLQRDS